MTIPTNDWYTIQAGDTLSKIAKGAGLPDWKTVYNDPKNDQFRKKRPDPDKIYPGDSIWIPGAVKTVTGKKTVFVAPAEKIAVTEIYFESEINVYFVRLLSSHSDYIAPGVPVNPGYFHFPRPTIRPDVGKAHWILDSSASKAFESWPVVLIRDGSPASGSAKRSLKVSFETSLPIDGDRIVKAETLGGEIIIGEQAVKFQKGKAAMASFTITKVPSTIEKLSGIPLKWSFKKNAGDPFKEACETKHTFYIIDNKPLKANLRRQDTYVFEVIDWSCSWARGMSGIKSVLPAIWKEFSPVKSNHSTGLVYWKNWDIPVNPVQPNQTIDFAIIGMDDPDPLSRNAASCAVFDNIFINSLTLQGIPAAEIRILPSAQSQAIFKHGGKRYKSFGFNASSVNGQGNSNAPPGWENHWIANVHVGVSQWKLYDASYGAAEYDSNDPNSNNPVDVLAYEKAGVKDFLCVNVDDNTEVNVPAGSTPTDPPHLTGNVLWKP
jgi:hypothetical protein